ncbi:glutamate--cysteine ligase [Paratissierella segnis]|jgi:glutamate--cysteine ligase|uniref:Glutamate--cysteine ligase n=1 Tax=Paratissierella segnis TaxID=2763679 RepID=A0A926IEA8_9FIRM|nr:glutamate-cysteine ligase family protein [Paratissierella segnis]MBC8587172.1 glutamate--cysteine ligase [Paratissierella segnis]
MDYNRQVEEIVKYIKDGEKKEEDFKIGIEFEHFVIYKDTFKTVSYYGENGVAETLKDLEKSGWNSKYEGEYILELGKGNKTITLEPGSQLELSLSADRSIKNIEKGYLEFLKELIPILDSKNQALIAVGYHPVTKIDEIKLLPKKRYDYMFEYFKKRGSHAHNMMKGTAALQVSMDYKDEEDYKKKFRVTNALSPIMYSLFENAVFFEGERYEKHNLRAFIWKNCDTNRSGVAEGALDESFNYESYAKYILNRPPIFTIKKGKLEFTDEKLVKEVFNPKDYEKEELEHLLTMFFPDVRTKTFIEIRMMDSIPYPLNFAVVALWKGLLYNKENLDIVYEYTKDINIEDVEKTKEEMFELGLNAHYKDKSILELGKWLVSLAKNGLDEDEVPYIYPLEGMVSEDTNPYKITEEMLGQGKKKALDWCVLKE